MRGQDLARTGLAVVAWLFVGCIFVQIFLAGLGVFDTASAFETHRDFAYLFGWLTLVMLILAAVGRVPRSLLGLAALTLVLFALQSVLVALRSDYPVVAALHPVNGVALLIVAIVIARRATALRAVPAPDRTRTSDAPASPASDRMPTA
jgi:mercuric ion transport protein